MQLTSLPLGNMCLSFLCKFEGILDNETICILGFQRMKPERIGKKNGSNKEQICDHFLGEGSRPFLCLEITHMIK